MAQKVYFADLTHTGAGVNSQGFSFGRWLCDGPCQ